MLLAQFIIFCAVYKYLRSFEIAQNIHVRIYHVYASGCFHARQLLYTCVYANYVCKYFEIAQIDKLCRTYMYIHVYTLP